MPHELPGYVPIVLTLIVIFIVYYGFIYLGDDDDKINGKSSKISTKASQVQQKKKIVVGGPYSKYVLADVFNSISSRSKKSYQPPHI